MNIFLNVMLVIISFIILNLVFFLFIKIRICVDFEKKNDGKFKYKVLVSAFGGRIKKKLLPSNKDNYKIKKPKENSMQSENTDSSDSNHGFAEKVRGYYRNFLRFKYTFSKSRPKIRKIVHAEAVELKVAFGTGDAAATGTSVGVLWAGVYNVIAFIANFITITEPKVEITPDFENQYLELSGKCIIVSRVANIITMVIYVGINYYLANRKINKLYKRKGGD